MASTFRNYWSLWLYFLYADFSIPCEADSFVERQTVFGNVRGFVETPLSGLEVESFLGVPYAAPPVDKLRFEYPQDPQKWSATRNATRLPPACPQRSLHYVRLHVPDFTEMSEDCLYINIYVPRVRSNDSGLPVLFYIHGGSNEFGMGAMFEGKVLAAVGDIVVVNFNYRLHALGFLSIGDENLPGNFGLFDQLHALKWVQRNIGFFGGDPKKVTIDGHSAGAADVGLHIMSPLTKGLFRYAVIQSGSPLAFWAVLEPNLKPGYNLEQYFDDVGCSLHDYSKNTIDLKNCLKGLPWESFTSALREWDQRFYRGQLIRFRPIVDNNYLHIHPLDEEQFFSHGESVLMGFTKNEVLSSVVDYPITDETLPFFLTAMLPEFTKFPHIVELELHEYKKWGEIEENSSAAVTFWEIRGDLSFLAPTIQFANKLSNHTQNVYMYSFEYLSTLSKFPRYVGVPHGHDMFFLFGYPFVGHPLHTYSDTDRQMSRLLIEIWSNFVKHGRPMADIDGKSQSFEAYTPQRGAYLKFCGNDTSVHVETDHKLRPRKMAFWNTLVPRLEKLNDSMCARSASFHLVNWTGSFTVTLGFVVTIYL